MAQHVRSTAKDYELQQHEVDHKSYGIQVCFHALMHLLKLCMTPFAFLARLLRPGVLASTQILQHLTAVVVAIMLAQRIRRYVGAFFSVGLCTLLQ
jgi:hypothetical protein